MDKIAYGQFERVRQNVATVLASATELTEALRTVRGTGATARSIARRPANRAASPVLTERERTILRLLADGLGNEDIAQRLHYGHGTIKLFVRGILQKLGTSSRVVAAVRATELGLLERRP